MNNLLMNCYYDGLTIAQATDFIARSYDKTPTQKQIENAQQTIKRTVNKEWN